MMVVTGANGFLGSYVVATLLKNGFLVKGTIRKGSNSITFDKILKKELANEYDSLIKNFTWVEADILDILTLDEIFLDSKFVFHCAAMVSFNKKDKHQMMAINTNGTANVVNACIQCKIKKLIHVSSTAAIGRAENNKLITEDTQWEESDNNTQYAISKYLAELEVWRGMEEGLNAVIVNPGIILGAGNWQQGSCKLFTNVANGFKFYTRGVNGFVDVKDVAKAMLLLANSEIKNERFLLIGENKSYQALFNAIATVLNVKEPSIELKKKYRKLYIVVTKWVNIFNSNSTITPETVNTSLSIHEYSNTKIKHALNFQFLPFEESINTIGKVYLLEN
ncbi:MAG: NAD-dependent epimerase/dehydratase family protein [Bacteroidetes bacterium]|nr:NAD-dependent epimerase/dehydratase family protein [Bacteroidota bacterium]